MTQYPLNQKLFSRCRNFYGPVDENIQKRIKNYVKRPSLNNWENIAHIVINKSANFTGTRTIWQAVRAVAPEFPNTGRMISKGKIVKDWTMIPSPEIVRRAIYEATERR